MADSFTSQLRLVKQTDQGNVNIWGKNYNGGVIDLAEDAIAGRQDLDVTLSNITLVTANGGDDTARPMFLRVTGNPGEARQIIVPSLQKMYVVSNLTSPGFSVEFKTVANAGVTVGAGSNAIIYVDQANDVVVSPISSGNTVSAAAAPFLTTTFDISNVTAGDTTVVVEYLRQGNIIICKMPAIDTTISVGGNSIILAPQTSVPAALIPSGPLSDEFPFCLEENGTQTPSFLQVPPINADWLINRIDQGTWTATSQRVMQYPLDFLMHVVNP